jgi:hypothetical protein
LLLPLPEPGPLPGNQGPGTPDPYRNSETTTNGHVEIGRGLRVGQSWLPVGHRNRFPEPRERSCAFRNESCSVLGPVVCTATLPHPTHPMPFSPTPWCLRGKVQALEQVPNIFGVGGLGWIQLLVQFCLSEVCCSMVLTQAGGRSESK